MHRRLLGALATAAIVFGACQGSTSPAPSSSSSSGTASQSPAGSSSPSGPSASPTPQNYDDILFNFQYAPEQGPSGGSIVIGDWQAANQLNYYYSTALANVYVYAATERSLFTVTADGHWKPDLASKMPKFSDNSIRADSSGTGFSVDLELKPGLLWSDGQPLTLEDLKYTFDWILDKDQVGINTAGYDQIDKFDVSTDGLKATVHFKAAYAGYYGILGGSPPLPEHYMKQFAIKDAKKAYPLTADIGKSVVSGPFKFSTASPTSVELVRNDNWKAGDHPAYLDKVTFQYFPDNKAGVVAAFKNQEIDVALDLVQDDYNSIKDVDPSFGKAILAPSWLYEHLDINQMGGGQGKGHPALKDPVVRKAMAMAIDKNAMFTTVFPGQTPQPDKVCTNALPTNYWRIPDDEVDCPAFDVTGANKLLDDAGYTKGTDGVRVDPKSKLALAFEHCSSNVNFRQTGGEFLAKSFQAIGIKLNLNFVDSTNVLFASWNDVSPDTKCSTYRGTYDTAEFGYSLTFDLFGDYYYSYASEQIPTDANKGNGYNTVRFNDREMDAALKKLKDAIKPADQVQAAYTVQKVYVDKLIEQALYYRSEVRGYAVRVHNLAWNPSAATELWNIEDFFIAQ
jgi:peptide/nickel transport system substrate-binding protein